MCSSDLYEIVYGDLVGRNARDAELLITISNDSWFGDSIGPWQHLQIAQMRGRENGRYVLRATNNGISAIIDHQGRILQRTEQFVATTLTGEAEPMLGVTPFVGEGHRKVWARLRLKGVRTSKQRTLRLMRAAGLLAPGRAKRALGPRVHDGTITPALPNVMWGTDATGVWTEREGMVTVFAAIDHATAECVWGHAAKYASRFEALEPLRQGVKKIFGSFAAGTAAGVQLRHDHGSQYVSDHFQSEIAFLGF